MSACSPRAGRARIHFAPNYFGRDVSTVYAELDAHTLLDENFRLFGHLGVIARIGGDGGGESRTRADLRLGAGWVWRGLDLQLRGSPPAAAGRTRRCTTAVAAPGSQSASYSF